MLVPPVVQLLLQEVVLVQHQLVPVLQSSLVQNEEHDHDANEGHSSRDSGNDWPGWVSVSSIRLGV